MRTLVVIGGMGNADVYTKRGKTKIIREAAALKKKLSANQRVRIFTSPKLIERTMAICFGSVFHSKVEDTYIFDREGNAEGCSAEVEQFVASLKDSCDVLIMVSGTGVTLGAQLLDSLGLSEKIRTKNGMRVFS